MAPVGRLTIDQYRELRKNDPKQSAVLICMYPLNKSVYTALILRPPEQGVHSDQVSFPGGAFEDADQSLEQTALREVSEEIGIDPFTVELLGRLTPVYIPVSNYLVQPVVGFMMNQPKFNLNKSEVRRIIEADCGEFLNEVNKGKHFFKSGMGIEIEAPYYEIQQQKIWGATAMILSELEVILRELDFPS
ncbi:MAG: NUDIX hydrolase [Chitinophagales bacterium]